MPPDTTIAPLGNELEQMTPKELKDWRDEHHLTQATLAKHLEVSLGTIRKYEQGERKIPAFMWRALRDLEREIIEEQQPKPKNRRPHPRSAEEGQDG